MGRTTVPTGDRDQPAVWKRATDGTGNSWSQKAQQRELRIRTSTTTEQMSLGDGSEDNACRTNMTQVASPHGSTCSIDLSSALRAPSTLFHRHRPMSSDGPTFYCVTFHRKPLFLLNNRPHVRVNSGHQKSSLYLQAH